MLEIFEFPLTTKSKREKFLSLRTHTYTRTRTATSAYIHNRHGQTLIHSFIHWLSCVTNSSGISGALCWRHSFSQSDECSAFVTLKSEMRINSEHAMSIEGHVPNTNISLRVSICWNRNKKRKRNYLTNRIVYVQDFSLENQMKISEFSKQ